MSHRWYVALELVLILLSVMVKFVLDEMFLALAILLAAWVTFMLGEYRRKITALNRLE